MYKEKPHNFNTGVCMTNLVSLKSHPSHYNFYKPYPYCAKKVMSLHRYFIFSKILTIPSALLVSEIMIILVLFSSLQCTYFIIIDTYI